MCNNNGLFGGNSCCGIIILLIVLWACCGNNNNGSFPTTPWCHIEATGAVSGPLSLDTANTTHCPLPIPRFLGTEVFYKTCPTSRLHMILKVNQ